MTATKKLTKGIDLELDYCTDGKSLEQFTKDVEADGGEVEVLSPSGPGGGWPCILLKAATKAELKKLVNKHYDASGETWADMGSEAQAF